MVCSQYQTGTTGITNTGIAIDTNPPIAACSLVAANLFSTQRFQLFGLMITVTPGVATDDVVDQNARSAS